MKQQLLLESYWKVFWLFTYLYSTRDFYQWQDRIDAQKLLSNLITMIKKKKTFKILVYTLFDQLKQKKCYAGLVKKNDNEKLKSIL